MTRDARASAASKRSTQRAPAGATLVRTNSSRANGSTTFTSAPASSAASSISKSAPQAAEANTTGACQRAARSRRVEATAASRCAGKRGRSRSVASIMWPVNATTSLARSTGSISVAAGSTRPSSRNWRRALAMRPVSCFASAHACAYRSRAPAVSPRRSAASATVSRSHPASATPRAASVASTSPASARAASRSPSSIDSDAALMPGNGSRASA